MKIELNDETLKSVSQELGHNDIINEVKNCIENNLDEYFEYYVENDKFKWFSVGNSSNAFTRTYRVTYENGIPDIKRVTSI